MMTKTMIVLATATILAIASAAQASSDKDATDVGGFHIGPLGQPMGAPYAWGAGAPWSAYRSYGYAPRGHVSRRWHYEP
jgi:hypothetical protein